MSGSSARFVATCDRVRAVSGGDVLRLTGKRVLVTGHRGRLGRALSARLTHEGCEVLGLSRREIDLADRQQVDDWFQRERPDIAILAAGRTGGLQAHRDAGRDMLVQNCAIALSTLAAADRAGVERVVFVSTSAIYPADAGHALSESEAFGGRLETAHRGYALAKLVGMELAAQISRSPHRNYTSAICTNLYGAVDVRPHSDQDVTTALFERFHNARMTGQPAVTIWGSGQARRDFLHVSDCANAMIAILGHAIPDDVNVGSGSDVSIAELAAIIAEITGFDGEIVFDRTGPEGTIRKLLDISTLRRIGWAPRTALRQGLESYYDIAFPDRGA